MSILHFFPASRRPCAGSEARSPSIASPEDYPARLHSALARALEWSGLTIKQPLRLPVRANGPIAILEPGFRCGPNSREFPPTDYAGLARFGPSVLVAALPAALDLAGRRLRGHLALPALQTALVVLTRLPDSPLTLSHRDLFWSAFGVPVFEHLMDEAGVIVARECEVHDGLHLDPFASLPQRDCELLADHCECGAETPRLKPLSLVRQRAAAATAA